MQEYKIDKKFFSVDDLSALLMGLSSLSGMVRGDEVAHALAKVKSFIPAERAKDIALRVNQIKLGTVYPKYYPREVVDFFAGITAGSIYWRA